MLESLWTRDTSARIREEDIDGVCERVGCRLTLGAAPSPSMSHSHVLVVRGSEVCLSGSRERKWRYIVVTTESGR